MYMYGELRQHQAFRAEELSSQWALAAELSANNNTHLAMFSRTM